MADAAFIQQIEQQAAANPAERRTTPRVGLCVEVGLQSDSNFYTGFTEDISEGGLFVATYKLLPTGTEMALTLTLPDGYEFRATAVVRWVRDPRDPNSDLRPGMGVQFVNLDLEHHDAIRDFILMRDPLFFEF
jgi:uncharacterized protein (TIGR02266 family)